MRRSYAVAGLAVAMGAGVWAMPAAGAGGSDDDSGGQVVRVMSREVDAADLDLGGRGFTIGDRFVFTDNLFMHGDRVGTDHGECVVTRIQGRGGAFQCAATAVLRGRGQITVQGVAFFSEDESPRFRLAVTGGTGEFRDAGGHLVVDERGAVDVLTFRLVD